MHIQWVYPLNRYDQLVKRVNGDRDKVHTLLGDKGASLAEMRQWGLPVPPAFTITSEATVAYWEGGQQTPEGLWRQLSVALADLEHETGKRFGDPTNALLLSCRVGGQGIHNRLVETILNLGLNDRIARGLIEEGGETSFVYELYQRLLHRFGSVVFGIPTSHFEAVLQSQGATPNGQKAEPANASRERELTSAFKTMIARESGTPFPQDPYDQLHLAIESAFQRGNGQTVFHATQGEATHKGVAITIEAMVYGNRNLHSATGIARTAHLKTGDPALEGEYALQAQGEVVEQGEIQTKPIADLALDFPRAWVELQHYCNQLERHYQTPPEVEFTIEADKLWLLEARPL